MKMITGVLKRIEELEGALLSCQAEGFARESVRWCPLEQQQKLEEPASFLGWMTRGGVFGDTIDHADRVSLMDGTCVGAAIGGLFGFSLGATWAMGSVTAGVLGMLLGGLVGWGIDQLVRDRRSRRQTAREMGRYGFVVLICCADQERLQKAREVLEASQGVLIGEVDLSPPGPKQRVSPLVWPNLAAGPELK